MHLSKNMQSERSSSQLPALELLQFLGYQYISPTEATSLRDNFHNPVLTKVLRDQLEKMNTYEYKGEQYNFSDSNLDQAVRDLDIPLTEGLVHTNEKIYDLLMLGKSYEEFTVDGNRRSFNIKYIDWENFANNVFHVTDEFQIEREKGNEHIYTDIVLFINGIPVGVIENKRSSIPLSQGISQMIRNQKPQFAPQLFKYVQIVMATNRRDAKYATCGTPDKFWALWREEELNWQTELLNKAITDREVTQQDQDIVSLFHPERLKEITQHFIVFDNNVKKIARYQQFFGVKEIVKRVTQFDEHGNRESGVIWHTQGSGKSLTMVMFAKYIFSALRDVFPKVVVVTDRVDLDNQIYQTFQHTRLRPNQASTGRHLVNLINDNAADIITTIVNKFETAADYQEPILSRDIFVLVDESHRTQYGKFHNKLRQIFPRASYLGFTGTPLMKKEKNTMMKFGDLIHTYTIADAVRDETILPLFYEGLMVEQEVDQGVVDRNLAMITKGLTEEQIVEVKKRWSTLQRVASSKRRIQLITLWIIEHYNKTLAKTNLNAMLATSSKADAVRYLAAFEYYDGPKAKVIISPPDTREGHEDRSKESSDIVQNYWVRMMDKYGDEARYESTIKDQFIHGDFDILIVVDKLLTGFDAPRAAVLYVDKPLKSHNLLQAIARVNRLYENKDRGLIIDFRGLLTELSTAMNVYSGSGLENFDPEDLQGTLYDSLDISGELRQYYTHLLDRFKGVKNKKDIEAYEVYLADQKIREDFYVKLKNVENSLKFAISSFHVYNAMEEEIKKIKAEVKFYQELRRSVRLRYGDTIDMQKIDPKMQQIIDSDLTSKDPVRITKRVNITDKNDLLREVEMLEGEASKADAIRSRISQRINDNRGKHPAYYKKFSEMLMETFNKYKEKRISEKEYLEAMYQHADDFEEKDIIGYPENIQHNYHAQAFYGSMYDTLTENFAEYQTNTTEEDMKETLAQASLDIEDAIRKEIKVDWHKNEDVKNSLEQAVEDLLFEYKEKYGLNIDWDTIDKLNHQIQEITRQRF